MEQPKEHILACLSSAPSNAKIIRTAATMAQLEAASAWVGRLALGDYVFEQGADGHLSLR